jgi:ABC-2 type transport system ATP-binding protein
VNAVQATSLVKEYRAFRSSVRALDGVDLEVGPGECFGLLGPNGAGKTTFVKLLLGLLKPTSGTITLLGRNPHDPACRRGVGFAPEIPVFPPFLSAPEVMRLHGHLAGLGSREIEAQTEALLAQEDLQGAPRRVKAFSKGMVRRLALAQASLGDPQFLVLDEPTADLDPIGRRDVRNQLLAHKERGATVVLNSHLLSEVERVCDRVAIIHKGRMLAQGAVEDLVPQGKDLETVFVELIESQGR